MYPDLSYLLHAIFGTEVDNGFSIVKTFGLMLAVAILTSAYFLNLELKRKEKEGSLKPNSVKTVIGKPTSWIEVLFNAAFGFFLGFKLVYVFLNFPEFKTDAPDVIFSTKGHLLAGIIGALILGSIKLKERLDKKKLKVQTITSEVFPSDRIGDITLIAAFTGIIGAKLFAIFENFSTLTLDGFFSALFSGGGLAIYGGLIGGFIGVISYLKIHKINVPKVADAVAPALIIGYGVGRLGCQLSGDGDWGIANELPPPSWWAFPEWMWAYDYPQNVLNEGIKIDGCEGLYCNKLATSVYPTPIYEMIMTAIIALILWGLRKRLAVPGMLFCVYLMLNGVERFWIEKIRINDVHPYFGIESTQAELIAVILFIIGAIGYFILRRKGNSSE